MNVTPYANSLFEQPWWLDIVAPGQWQEALVKEGDEVVARMPYVLQGKKIVMPPLTQTLGPWIKAEYRQFQPGNTQLSRQKELICSLLEQLPAHKSFKMTFDSANEYILPYRWLGYRYEPSFSYRLCSLEDVDQLQTNFNKTAKKNIRRAEKMIYIDRTVDPDRLYDQLQKTFGNQNRKYPYPKSLCTKIVETATALGHGAMFSALDDSGNVHACSFLVYDDQCAYALLGGADPAYRGSGAKSLVWRDEIVFAASVSKMFDFEGSNIEGIENFVRQFGGSAVINYSVSKQPLLADCLDMLKPRIKRMMGYKL